MLCKTCGKELPESAKFCNWCGAKIEQLQPAAPAGQANATSSVKKRKKSLIIVAIVLLAIVCVAGYGWYSHLNTWEYQFTKAMEYRDQGECEKAIPVFQKAIECDPLNATAYHRLSEIYAKIGDEYASENILRQYRIARGRTAWTQTWFDGNGTLVSATVQYDDAGRKTNFDCALSEDYKPEHETWYLLGAWYQYDGEYESSIVSMVVRTGFSPYSEQYSYDEKSGLLREVSFVYLNGLARTSSYNTAYTADGRPQEIISYNKDGRMSSKSTYEYGDREWSVNEIHFYDGDESCFTAEYRNESEELSTCSSSWDDNICAYDKYYYRNGNLSECEYYSCNDSLVLNYRITFDYDENGNRIRETAYDYNPQLQTERLEYWSEFQYDKNGDLTHITVYDEDGTVTSSCDFTYTDANLSHRN